MGEERERLENRDDPPAYDGLPDGEIGDAYRAMVTDSELGGKFEELKKEHGGTPEQSELDWSDVTVDTIGQKDGSLENEDGRYAKKNWLSPVERAVNIPADYVADKALWLAKSGLGAVSATAQLTEYTHDQDRALMNSILQDKQDGFEPQTRWEHWKELADPDKQSVGTLGQELIPVASQLDAYQDLRSVESLPAKAIMAADLLPFVPIALAGPKPRKPSKLPLRLTHCWQSITSR